jgi:hypothetical protein
MIGASTTFIKSFCRDLAYRWRLPGRSSFIIRVFTEKLGSLAGEVTPETLRMSLERVLIGGWQESWWQQ